MKMREFVHENFAEREVFLLNCPLSNLTPADGAIMGHGNVGQKAVKNLNS